MKLDFYKGKEAAERDVDLPDFDVDAAIASFDRDPADNAFQRGYLHGLIKSGYAEEKPMRFKMSHGPDGDVRMSRTN